MAKRKKAGVSTPAMSSSYPQKDYQAEDDARTIERYAELCAGKGRHGRAEGVVKKRMGALSSIVGGGASKGGDKAARYKRLVGKPL